jgi:hypothetical protein
VVRPGQYVVVANTDGDWNIVQAASLDNGDVRCNTDFSSPEDNTLMDVDPDYYGHGDPVVFMQNVLAVSDTLAEAQEIAESVEEARLRYVQEIKPSRDKLHSKLLLLKC